MIFGRLSKTLRLINSSRIAFPFSEKSGDNNFGIKIDEDAIKRKMKQIKQRKESDKNQSNGKFDFMSVQTNSQILKKIKQFRRSTDTEDLFNFTDVTVQQKPTNLQVTGFDQTSIEIDGMSYPPSLIIFPKQVLIWEVPSAENITIDDFIILKYISPKPTYVVVGVRQPQKFPTHIAEYLRSKHQDFDVLQLFEATSQFNITCNDDLNVVAFMISK